jgi:small subunit ribosomal protein S8
MTMTDPISDMLTRIRNANIAMHDDVRMPSSKVKEALAEILHKEGYIEGYEVADNTERPGRTLSIKMKYSPERARVISGLRRACASTASRPRSPGSSAGWVWPSSRPARGS